MIARRLSSESGPERWIAAQIPLTRDGPDVLLLARAGPDAPPASLVHTQILKYWDRIRSSFWFIPVIMSVAAVTLVFFAVGLNDPIIDWVERTWGWSFAGGAEGASTLLGTVAGSMITIAGVVFSLTLVALSLTSSQFGPRLLRSFMRDRTTQVALGTFVATFLYCMLVLRTIRHPDDVSFVPHLAINLGVVLTVVSVGVLIYFIHHVSVSIQANEIVARVGDELIQGIDHVFPEQLGRVAHHTSAEPPSEAILELVDREGWPIGASGDGYLKFIDGESLIELAAEADAILRIEKRPGHYIVLGHPLVHVWPPDCFTEAFSRRVDRAFVRGHHRTSSQDLEFAVEQLVEIAVRALSPSLNDPFTAIACVDRLGSALCRLAQRDTPSPYLFDQHDQLRIIASSITFPAVTDAAFNQIRQYGRSSAAVSIRLLETICVIGRCTRRPEDRAALLHHADMILRGAEEGLYEEEDRRAARERYQAVSRLCSVSAGVA